MPDMATALKNALESWEPTTKEEKQMPPALFRIRNNVTRETFAYIQQHPATTMKATLEALKAKGYKESSVSSIVSQLMRAEQIKREDGKLSVLVAEYQPLKASVLKKATTAKQAKAAKPPKPARRWAEPELLPLPEAPHVNAMSPEAWAAKYLEKLTVLDARALYDELRRVFEK